MPPSKRSKTKQPAGFSEGQKQFEAELPERINLTLGPGGRIVIPAVYRRAMQVEEGGRLMARVVDGELKLITPQMAIKRVQRMVRATIPPGGPSLIDTLFEMRRQEVEDEFGDG